MAKQIIDISDIERIENEEKFMVDALDIKPEFMKDTKITAAHKGTIMHICFQKLDLRKNYSLEDLKELVNKLVHDRLITEEEKNTINIYKLKSFVDSEFAKRIREAEKIEKEKPFYTYVKAREIYNRESDENILVQGIIDLYYKEKDGNIVLVDYKTDYVQNEEELVEKYKIQLELYKNALENALGTKINDVYIYSIYLEKEIKV